MSSASSPSGNNGQGSSSGNQTSATQPKILSGLDAQAVQSDKKRKDFGIKPTQAPKKKPKISNKGLSDAEKRQLELEDLEKELRDWRSQPRGRDVPPISHMIMEANRPKEAILMVANDAFPEVLTMAVKANLEFSSQTPCLMLTFRKLFDDSDHEGMPTASIRAHNIVMLPPDSDETAPDAMFLQGSDRLEKVDIKEEYAKHVKDLISQFESDLGPAPAEEDMEKVIQLGKTGDGTLSFIQFMGFYHDNGFFYNVQKAVVDESDEEGVAFKAKLDRLEQFLNSGRSRVILFRQNFNSIANFAFIDRYWMNVMETIAKKGVYPFYRRSLGRWAGSLFEDWIFENPDKRLPRQEWMRIPGSARAMMEFASHVDRNAYGTPEEMEIALSLGVVGEGMWENVCIEKYFTFSTKHTAKVVDKKGDYVQLGIFVEKYEVIQMPQVNPGSMLKVLVCPEVDQIARGAPSNSVTDFPALTSQASMFASQPVQAGPSNAPAQTAEPGPSNPTEGSFQTVENKKKKSVRPEGGWIPANQEFNARCIEIDRENADFVIAFHVKDVNQRKGFIRNQWIVVRLRLKRNAIPATPQLEAVSQLYAPQATGNLLMLQKLVQGCGKPSFSESVDQYHRQHIMNEEGKRVLDMHLGGLKLNKPQIDLFYALFTSTKNFMTVLEGPPGNGKTTVDAIAAVVFAQYGIRVLLTAPSNTAAKELMKKLHDALQTLYGHSQKAKDWFEAVYVPTNSDTRAGLENFNIEQLTSDMVAEGEAQSDAIIERYKLWGKVMARFEDQKTDPAANAVEQANAVKWFTWMHGIKIGTTMKSTDRKKFWDLTEDMYRKIFSPKGNTRLVVCTCSTAATLKDYGYLPGANIVDEAAFATSVEALIPLTSGARYNLVSGDASQLRPVVRSYGHSEYSSMFGISIYSKLFGHPSVNTIRLRLNYRMHPEIAFLPGILTYGFLACAPNTLEDSDTFKYYRDWWNSSAAQTWRDLRQAPAYGKKATDVVGNIRRKFVNVKNGMSASKVGGTSKRNFANINAMCDFLGSLLNHTPGEGIQDIDHDKITILSPYKEEIVEVERQVRFRLRYQFGDQVKRFLRFRTIDNLQGAENEICLFLLTPADQHNGSILGSNKDWNRMNLALTRAKSVLVMFGNHDKWRSQLKVIGSVLRRKNYALMVVDLLDLGDVLEMEAPNILPKNFLEIKSGDWSMEIEETLAENSRLSSTARFVQSTYNRVEYEAELLKELEEKRKAGMNLERRLLGGEEVTLPLAGQ